MLKRTFKKLSLPIIALAGMLMFVGPPKADARVHFGVYWGGPAYPYVYDPYPYYGYRYVYPYDAYGYYYYGYPYYHGRYYRDWDRDWDRD